MSNPFAPFAQQEQSQLAKAPKLTGLPMPDSRYQKKPSLMETIGPAVASEAMGSEAAGDLGGFLGKTSKDVWTSLSGPAVSPSVIPVSESVGVFSDAAMLNGMGSGITTVAPSVATAGATAAEIAAGAGSLATTGATAAELAAGAGAFAAPVAATTGAAAAAAAPAALLAGPFAPLIIGGAMLAASGK